MFCPALSIGAALIIIRTAPHRECPSGQEHPAVPIDAALHRALPLRGNSATHHQSTQALLPTPFPSALLRRKMLLLRKSICTGAIHLPLCFLMSYGFLARSRASIRSAAENCYRRNSLPPLNNLNQAETRSAASRPKKSTTFVVDFFGAGYGSRTRLNGLGSRCNTDIPTLRTDGVYHILRVISRRNIHVVADSFIFFAKRRKELRHETNVPDDPAVRAAFVRARARRRAHARRPLRSLDGKADQHGALCQG